MWEAGIMYYSDGFDSKQQSLVIQQLLKRIYARSIKAKRIDVGS